MSDTLIGSTKLNLIDDHRPIDLFRDDQGGWTKKIMTRLKELKQKSWDYTWIHRENSSYLNDVYDWLSVGSFVGSFFNGAILIFRTNLIYIQVFTIILSFATGLLQFFIKFKNYPELIEKHKMASSRFSAIHNNIERQLSLPVKMRQNPLHFHQWISQQFETLFHTAPDIDSPIIDKYRSNLEKVEKGNHRISYAWEADRFDMGNDSSSGEVQIQQTLNLDSANDPDMDSISSDSYSTSSEYHSTINYDDKKDVKGLNTEKNQNENNYDHNDDNSQNNRDNEDEKSQPDIFQLSHHSSSRRSSSLDKNERNYSPSGSRRRSNLEKNEIKYEELLKAKSKSRKNKRKKNRDLKKYLNYEKGRFDANYLYQNSLNYNLNNKCLMDDVVLSAYSKN